MYKICSCPTGGRAIDISGYCIGDTEYYRFPVECTQIYYKNKDNLSTLSRGYPRIGVPRLSLNISTPAKAC